MEYKDAIHGEIYYQDYYEDGLYCYIFKYDKRKDNDVNYGKFIFINNNKYEKSPSCNGDVKKWNTVRPATEQEKLWLNTCIEKDKFVELKDCVPIELIFNIY